MFVTTVFGLKVPAATAATEKLLDGAIAVMLGKPA